jgi:hypothetical protein
MRLVNGQLTAVSRGVSTPPVSQWGLVSVEQQMGTSYAQPPLNE